MFKLITVLSIFIISQLQIQSSEVGIIEYKPPYIKPLKILLVEDNLCTINIFKKQIHSYAHSAKQPIEVSFATTEEEAISHYKNNNNFDLILMDLHFPSTSCYCNETGLLPGIVTARKIRNMGYGNIMLAVTNVCGQHLIKLKRHNPFLFRKWRDKITNQVDLQQVLNLITVI